MDQDKLAFSATNSSLVVQAICWDVITAGVNLDIHVDDEMLLFFLYAQGRELDVAASMYFESGRRIWATERQVIARAFGSLGRVGRLLDFGSGYGRVTRHMVTEMPPESIWVSDLYAGGVAFQERRFGVHGVVSTSDPGSLAGGLKFDCILVSSVFTHLPSPRFTGWLRHLGSLLADDGLLLFSVHDMSLLRGEGRTGSEFEFREASESGTLAASEYGTFWVTEDFVRSAVCEAIGPYPLQRISRGLASFQDLYVLARGECAAATLGLLSDPLEREPDGFLEHCSLAGNRRLQLSGWLADRVAGGPPSEVRIEIDGRRVGTCRDLRARPGDTQALATDPAPVVGWQASVELPRESELESARLSVLPVSARGEEMVLYRGSLTRALLRSAQLDAFSLHRRLREGSAEQERLEELVTNQRAHIDGLARRIEAMTASRFWKAREQWFALKRAIGLTKQR
jgi:SAM-dependent methyltransferase